MIKISDFLAESLKANKNYRKRSLILQYSFAQKSHFMDLNLSLDTKLCGISRKQQNK